MVSILDMVMTVHTIFAALWTGGTILVAGAVIPAARNGLIGKEGLTLIARRFSYLAIASALLLFFSGGHLAGNLYTVELLTSSFRGNLVLTMVGLWFVLAVVLFFGFRRLTNLPQEMTAVTAATKARPWFLGGSVVSIALLIVAGLL